SHVSSVSDLRPPISDLRLRGFLDSAVLLLLVIGFFAALDASEKGYAFYDWRVTFLTPALFYLLITRFTLRREGGVRLLGNAALLGGALVSGIALWQFITGQAGVAEGVPRVQALYGSANNLALALGRVLPLAVVLAFFHHGDTEGAEEERVRHGERTSFSLVDFSPCAPRLRVVYFLVLLIIAAAGFLTFSKGLLFISIPVGLAVLFIFQRSLRKPILALTLLGALALLPFLNTPRLTQIASGTGRFRLYLWQSAWRMWLDHPWLGVGPDNFLYAYRSFYVLPAAWEELNLSHPHNLIFDLLTRVGLLGLLAGMGLVLGTIGLGFRRLREAISPDHPLRPWLLGLWAGFIAGMAHGLIDNSLFLPDLMVLSLLVAGVAGVSMGEHSRGTEF
ncbi:MAG TPA: O-antigen ligase domain-containing protein, partial [Caldilineales bacterium]|nr:O-antigen ligase domain-containing protein [Caldilineales bacterium]